MKIFTITLGLVLVFGGCFVLYLVFFNEKRIKPPKEPNENDLVAAIIAGIKAGEWVKDTYGFSPCMKNKITKAEIYLEGILEGDFCGNTYAWKRGRNGKKVTKAFKDHQGISTLSDIQKITGSVYKPPDDVDPALVKEAKKTLKLWTK